MANRFSKARSYAKAVFDLAKETDKLARWQSFLFQAAEVSSDPARLLWLLSPSVAVEVKLGLFAMVTVDFVEGTNLLRLLLLHRELALLPEIAKQYEALLLAYNGVIRVNLTSAVALSSQQRQRLESILKCRYGGKVQVVYKIDKELLGGASLQMAGKTLDWSIRGRLEKLRTVLN